MLQTVEAEVGENGQIRLRSPLVLRGWHRAVLTVLEPLTEEDNEAGQTLVPHRDWHRFVGTLKDSPRFNGDPVAIQRDMRDE
jgi:hypothetical protein